MADITSIAFLYLLWKRERRQNARRLWVHETIRSRTELCEFHRLLQELRLDGERFQRYLRLTPAQFDDLLARIGARISRLDTNYRRSISASERLSICLRFAARQVLPAVLLNAFTTMADITSIAFLYLLWKRERRQNARRLWVHETIRSRTELCEFHRLLQELRLDGERFQRYLRLTPAQFDDLLARIGARSSRLDTNYRRSISASERLSICLRSSVWMANASSAI
ncbi:unnamed protein product [Arctogadus glacialis]